MTGNGFKRANSVMVQENGSRAVLIDSHGRMVILEGRIPFDPLRQTNKAKFGTWAERAQFADGIARAYFNSIPIPNYPFWRVNNLWAWPAGILVLYACIFIFAYVRSRWS